MSSHILTIDGIDYPMSADSIVRIYSDVLAAQLGTPKMLQLDVERDGESYCAMVFIGAHSSIRIVTTPDVMEALQLSHGTPPRMDDQ